MTGTSSLGDCFASLNSDKTKFDQTSDDNVRQMLVSNFITESIFCVFITFSTTC